MSRAYVFALFALFASIAKVSDFAVDIEDALKFLCIGACRPSPPLA